MLKKEIYSEILRKVSEVTGVCEHDMINSRGEECSDARFLLVKALSFLKFTDVEIGGMVKRTSKGTRYIRQCELRLEKWIVGSNWEEIKKWMESKYFIST